MRENARDYSNRRISVNPIFRSGAQPYSGDELRKLNENAGDALLSFLLLRWTGLRGSDRLLAKAALHSVSEHVGSPENQENSCDSAEKQSLPRQLLNEHEYGNGSYPEQVHHAGYKQERH